MSQSGQTPPGAAPDLADHPAGAPGALPRPVSAATGASGIAGPASDAATVSLPRAGEGASAAEPDTSKNDVPFRPAEFARLARGSIEVSEGRRRRRQRDTLADSLGLDMKRDLLLAIEAADPEPEDFERFLLEYALTHQPSGSIRGVCTDLWSEWESAQLAPTFADWLRSGAQERGDENRAAGRRGQRESFRPDRPRSRETGDPS